jgi:hypothetical protein
MSVPARCAREWATRCPTPTRRNAAKQTERLYCNVQHLSNQLDRLAVIRYNAAKAGALQRVEEESTPHQMSDEEQEE